MAGCSSWLLVRAEDGGRDFWLESGSRARSKEGDIGLRGGGGAT